MLRPLKKQARSGDIVARVAPNRFGALLVGCHTLAGAGGFCSRFEETWSDHGRRIDGLQPLVACLELPHARSAATVLAEVAGEPRTPARSLASLAAAEPLRRIA